MCGRFALDEATNDSISEFVELHGVQRLSEWEPNWNIRPTDPILAVIDSPREGLVTHTARWSLVPSWSKELKLRFPTFNARSEDVASKRTFAPSVVSKRSLLPALGYFEWHTEGRVKTPYFIHSVDPREPMMFAGLYSWWRDPAKADDDESRWVLTATMLTMDAAPSLAGIHDRNPVVVPREWWRDWLDPELPGDQAMVDALVAAATPLADSLEYYEVAPLRGEGPELVAPLTS